MNAPEDALVALDRMLDQVAHTAGDNAGRARSVEDYLTVREALVRVAEREAQAWDEGYEVAISDTEARSAPPGPCGPVDPTPNPYPKDQHEHEWVYVDTVDFGLAGPSSISIYRCACGAEMNER